MGSLPMPLVETLQHELRLEQAVETGTYKGGTSALLAKQFRVAMTIELSRDLHEAAARELAYLPNLTLLHSNSPEALSRLDRAQGGALFWLDAHWSGLDTAGRDNPCPVIEEIRAIGP